jgi:hypothetical protein
MTLPRLYGERQEASYRSHGTRAESHKELNAKLNLFRAQVAADELLLADPAKFNRDRELLGLETTYEVLDLLNEMAGEVKPEHYCPPPTRKQSYEEACFGAPLYDFTWASVIRNEEMYLKFAVAAEQCYLVSCHPDRKKQ